MKRVLRGGSWNNKPNNVRCANRNNNNPTNRNNNIGFRCAKTSAGISFLTGKGSEQTSPSSFLLSQGKDKECGNRVSNERFPRSDMIRIMYALRYNSFGVENGIAI
jgi:hypothetical protein